MNASSVLTNSFEILAALTAGGALLLVRLAYRNAAKTAMATLAIGLWLVFTYGAASRGVVRFDTRPPTFFLFVATAIALTLVLALGRVGERFANGVPFAALIGLQGFRLPLELMMHRAYSEGVMPVQMSYSGRNFDIVSGVSAIVVAAILVFSDSPLKTTIVRLWNVAGALLLLNVVTIAVLSTPTPLRLFHDGPANVWIRFGPFVWLPTFFVPLALFGHVVIARKLRRERQTVPATASEPAAA